MVKRDIHILVNEQILKHWDELADSIGISRTAFLHNSAKLYEMFIKNQLNSEDERDIKEQLNQIETLIKGLAKQKQFLLKEKDTIGREIEENDFESDNLEIVKTRVLALLKDWAPTRLSEQTIAGHLRYPTWIVWAVLKKLKSQKVITLKRGEWGFE